MKDYPLPSRDSIMISVFVGIGLSKEVISNI